MNSLARIATIAIAATVIGLGVWKGLRRLGVLDSPRTKQPTIEELISQRDHVTLVFSGRLMAEIVSCGCRSNRDGGIARLATALRSVQERSPNTAVIDAGDSLVSADAQGKHPVSNITRKKAQVMADFLAATPHNAVALGDLDLQRGPAETVRLLHDRDIAPVITNVRFTDPAVKTAKHSAWDTGGYRFVVFNLFTKEALVGIEGAEWSDPVAALESEIAAAGPADVLLIACHRLGDDLTRRVSETPGAPRIVIDVDGTSKYQTSERTSRAVFIRMPPTATMLMYAELSLRKGASAWYHARSYPRSVSAGVDMELEAGAARASQIIDVGFLVVDDKYEKDPPMEMLAGRYQQWVRETALEEATADDTAPRYTGALACGACHPTQLANWKSTMHAKAWESLEKAPDNATADPECASCHVSGLSRPGGPRRLADIGPFKGVQCESCHFPAAKHPGGAKLPAVLEATCRGCHSETRDPDFNFATYLKFATCTQPHDPAKNRVPR